MGRWVLSQMQTKNSISTKPLNRMNDGHTMCIYPQSDTFVRSARICRASLYHMSMQAVKVEQHALLYRKLLWRRATVSGPRSWSSDETELSSVGNTIRDAALLEIGCSHSDDVLSASELCLIIKGGGLKEGYGSCAYGDHGAYIGGGTA